ncbi:MAG: type IX secretion system membrane protein PorP/SprF, partial [Endomicrobiia bacterium]
VTFLLTAYCLLLTSNFLSGAFKDPGWGARPLGLAGAFTAISDDSTAIVFNPAGLSDVYLNQFDFMYGKPFVQLEGVNMNYYLLTGVINLTHKTKLGIGYTNFTTENLYREDSLHIAVCYAPKLTDFNESFSGTIKFLYHNFVPDEYTKDDIVFSKTTNSSAFSYDFGLMMKFFERIKFGISIKDINQPDMGLKDKDIVPVSYNFGVAYLHSLTSMRCIYTVDTSIRAKENNISLGVESWFGGEQLGIRVGANLTEIALGATYRFNVNPSLSMETTYAFVWPIYIQQTYGTHRLSIGIRF